MSRGPSLDDDDWYTRAEMARQLDISERAVIRRARRGELERQTALDGSEILYRQTDSMEDSRERTAPESASGSPINESDEPDDLRETAHAAESKLSALLDRLERRDDAPETTSAWEEAELTDHLERARAEIARLQGQLEAYRDGEGASLSLET